jgi:hypothetical protein
MKKKHYLLLFATIMACVVIAVATIPFMYHYVVHEWASFTLFVVIEILALYTIWLFIRAYKSWTEPIDMFLKIDIPVRWLDEGAWILSKFLERTRYREHDAFIHGYWKRLCDEHAVLRFHPYVFRVRKTDYPAGVLTISNESDATDESSEYLHLFNECIGEKLDAWAKVELDKVEKTN